MKKKFPHLLAIRIYLFPNLSILIILECPLREYQQRVIKEEIFEIALEEYFFSIRHSERTISMKGRLVQQQLAGTNTLSSLLKIAGCSLLSFLYEEMEVCSPNCPMPCRGLFPTSPHPHRQGQASLLLLTNAESSFVCASLPASWPS